jgi:hypothetical protein
MRNLHRVALQLIGLTVLLVAGTPAFSTPRVIDPGDGGGGGCGPEVSVERGGATTFTLETSEGAACGTFMSFNLHLHRALEYGEVVTVRVSSSNAEALVMFNFQSGPCSGSGLVDFEFNYWNWNQPIQVWIAGMNDNALDGDQPYTISVKNLTRNDLYCEPVINIPGINHDNAFRRISFTQHSGVTNYRGAVMGTQLRPSCNYAGCWPTSNVDVTLTTSHPSQGLLKTASDPTPRNQITLSYTPSNGNVYQWAYVVGVDDKIPSGDHPYTVTMTTASADARWNGLTDTLNVINKGPSEAETCINDVVSKFNGLPWQGQRLRIGDDLLPAGEYRPPGCSFFNPDLGNHFQGVARSNRGPYLFITGRGEGDSHLYTARVDKNGIPGRWGGNYGGSNEEFVWYGNIDPAYEHAGGLSLMGDFAAIPLEWTEGFWCQNFNCSKIVFYDVWDPLNPVPLPEVVHRGNYHHAGAATVTKLRSGFFTNRYLLAVQSDDPAEIQFYLSSGETIQSATEVFSETPLGVWSTQQHGAPNYNSITFIQDCGGMLYLIGTYNNGFAGGGTNLSDLYRVTPPNRIVAETIPPTLTYVSTVDSDCDNGDWCNFSAAAGAYAATNGELILYSTHYYRDMNGGELSQCDHEAPLYGMEF